jgi:hypothetical protein
MGKAVDQRFVSESGPVGSCSAPSAGAPRDRAGVAGQTGDRLVAALGHQYRRGGAVLGHLRKRRVAELVEGGAGVGERLQPRAGITLGGGPQRYNARDLLSRW